MAGRFSVHAVFKATDKMSGVLGKIESRMGKMARTASREMEKIDKAMGKIGSGMKHGAVAIAAGAGTAAAGIASVVKPALELETAMAKVSTVISTADGDIRSIPAAMEKTKKAALDWSNAHTQAAEEFLEANYNMASAGLNSEQALAGTRAALTLATATLGDAATAGNLLATVYNNMGDKSAESGAEMMRLADILAKTQAVFQIADLSQLNESLKMGAPAAIQYGVSVEQLGNAVGALNTAGLAGSQAGTAFNASMRNMLKASKALKFEIAKTESGGVDFAGTLDNIAKKYGSFEKMTDAQKTAFQKAFGDEGLRAISLLLGKTDEFNKSLQAVTDSAGAAEKQQSQIEKARGAWLAIMSNQLHDMAGEFGEALLPALDKLKPLLDDVIGKFSHWIEANKGLIASKATEYIKQFIEALPEMVVWMKRIAIGVGVFWAMSAAVKAAQLSIMALNGTIAIIKGVSAAIRAIAAANALVAVTAAGAKAGIAGMAAPIAAAVAVTVALAAAAGAVGYALGSWLIPQGMIDEATDLISKLMGVERVLQTNNRGMGGGRGTAGQAREYADGTVIGVDGSMITKGSEWQKHIGASATPQVASPQERVARTISETTTTNQDSLGVTIKDETGRAVVTKKPKRAQLDMPRSGAM